MNATTLPAEIVAFAAAVRASLGDLPADEVEELTDGLEADLAEAYAEDLARELPDPAAYAAELRGAAGLPMHEPVAKPGRLRPIIDGFAEAARDIDSSLRKSPIMAWVLDFLATLQPAWWIVRGWAAYQVVGAVFGFEGDLLPSGWYWPVLLVLVAGSVFVGLWRWRAWVKILIVMGNVIAVIATIAGVVSKGEPLNGVQLFDQDGKPLATSVPGGNGCLVTWPDDDACKVPGAWVPSLLETGATVWNVYPVKMVESSLEDPTTAVPGAVPQDRPVPFVTVPALMTVAPAGEPAPKAPETTREKADKTP
jgi:hypothetical protein